MLVTVVEISPWNEAVLYRILHRLAGLLQNTFDRKPSLPCFPAPVTALYVLTIFRSKNFKYILCSPFLDMCFAFLPVEMVIAQASHQDKNRTILEEMDDPTVYNEK